MSGQKELVKRLMRKVQHPEVIRVLNRIDRANYVSENPYDNSPKPILCHQTISAPYMHAITLDIIVPYLLQSPRRNLKLLDVGCGSGYLTAAMGRWFRSDAAIASDDGEEVDDDDDNDSILSKQKSGTVYGMDIHPELVELTRTNLRKHDGDLLEQGTVQLKVGNGWEGWPEVAPFDAIHVGAAADGFPCTLADQLCVGGVMVVPLGPAEVWQGGPQVLVTVERVGETGDLKTDFVATSNMNVQYVPLIDKPEKEKTN